MEYPPKMYLVKKFLKDSGFTNIKRSTRKDKKIMASYNGKIYHAGNLKYQDYTTHRNEKRRQNYCKRSKGIKNSGPANMLARIGLWNCKN